MSGQGADRGTRSRAASKETAAYIQAVREACLSVAYTSGKFTASDARTACQMQADGIPLAVVQDAILAGACRKYVAWLNGGSAEPIRSVRYFEPIVAELRRQPLPPGYREPLQRHSARYGARWEAARAKDSAHFGGIPHRL